MGPRHAMVKHTGVPWSRVCLSEDLVVKGFEIPPEPLFELEDLLVEFDRILHESQPVERLIAFAFVENPSEVKLADQCHTRLSVGESTRIHSFSVAHEDEPPLAETPDGDNAPPATTATKPHFVELDDPPLLNEARQTDKGQSRVQVTTLVVLPEDHESVTGTREALSDLLAFEREAPDSVFSPLDDVHPTLPE